MDIAEFGFMAAIGSYVKITGGLLIDLYANYSFCELSLEDFGFNIGGFGAGIGIAFEF